jgi:menaquinone-dependent protoporphyrinogen oxidase
MRVLIAYGTGEGQTAKIAGRIAERLRSKGHTIEVADLGTAATAPEGYDGVVVGASIHAGKYQREVVHWVGTHGRTLNATPSWFFSVSLSEAGVLPGGGHQAAQAVLDGFLTSSKWSPREAVSLAGAISYRRYSWPIRKLVQLVVKRYGGEADTSRDHEYTDWEAVEGFADRVDAGVAAAGIPAN